MLLRHYYSAKTKLAEGMNEGFINSRAAWEAELLSKQLYIDRYTLLRAALSAQGFCQSKSIIKINIMMIN